MEIEKLEKYARDLEFTMEKNEYETLKNEFDVVFKQIDLLESVDNIKDYEPMDYPFVLSSAVLREDEVTMSLDNKEAFSNSKDVKNGCVKCPKVVS
jgi:aspartyl/glutamyl-tRNA(Asn/Gln) amidotransferase C subunit